MIQKVNKEDLNTIFQNSDCLSEDQLLAYTSNQLSNKERNIVERHTINCKFCSDAIEGFQLTPNSVKLYNSNKNSFKSTPSKNWFKIVAGIAALFIIGTILFKLGDTSQEHSAEIKTTEDKSYKSEKKLNDTIPSTNFVQSLTDSLPKEKKFKTKVLPKVSSPEKSEENKELKSYNWSIADTTSQLTIQNQPLNNYQPTVSDEVDKEEHHTSEEVSFTSEATNDNSLLKDEQQSTVKIRLESERGLKAKNDKFDDSIIDEKNAIEESTEIRASELVNEEIANDLEDSKEKLEEKTTESNNKASRARLKKSATTTAKRISVNTGFKLFEEKKYVLAINELQKVKQSDAQFYQAQLKIGHAYIHLDNKDKAKVYLKKALNGSDETKKEAQKLLKLTK